MSPLVAPLFHPDLRSARLSQFIIHRGLIISFIQAIFSALFYFAAIAIYNVRRKSTTRVTITITIPIITATVIVPVTIPLH